MPEQITIKPNDRFALIGKTGSGKTKFGLTLGTTIIRAVNKTALKPWQCWIIDTKGDPTDIERMRRWGYTRVQSMEGLVPDHDGENLYRFFVIEPGDEYDDTVEKAQHVFAAAKKHGNVLVNVDEYTSVVQSDRMPGKSLKDLFARGRGLRVGVIGQTQEPVYVPRQLASQASHLFLFDLSLTADIEWATKFCRGYERPVKQGYPHGFYYSHLDGDAAWHFFHHEAEFAREVLVEKPSDPESAEKGSNDTISPEKV
jgi:hypothetical protein